MPGSLGKVFHARGERVGTDILGTISMKKIDPATIGALIANIGVIGGLLLLAYEVRQNNELMEAEARMNRVNMVVDAWRFTAENGDLTELREREKNGEELSGADKRRVDAAVMAVFLLLEWTYRDMTGDPRQLEQVREVQRYNFSNAPEYPRVWSERKASFDADFVEWMERNVVGSK